MVTTDTPAGTSATAPPRRSRPTQVLLLLGAGLLLGGLAGLLLGPRSLTLGDEVSGDPLLARDFRATLGSARGLATVEVARLRGGQVTYAGLGPEGTALPTPQTTFELGSITKTMTGMLLADGVRRGELRLEARLSDYLPELAGTPAGAVTLLQLATHHSGLPELPPDLVGEAALGVYGNRNPYDLSTARLLQLTRTTPLRTPGEFAYSNLGMSLLGHAEARAARTVDWPTLARQRILVPLGMTGTTFVTTAAQLPADSAPPRHENGWRAPHWYGAAFAPAGSSTFTTAEDVMRYARAVVTGRAPGMAALDPVADAGKGRIGLAWVTTPVSGRSITWHNGGTGGYRSVLALDRGSGQAVLVLNSSLRSVDQPGQQLAAAAPEAARGTPARADGDRPATGGPPIVALAAGLLLLGTGVLSLLRPRHRIRVVGAAVDAVSGLVLLRVHGPWALAPAELWSVLVGLALAALVIGALRWPALPVAPGRRRWWAWTSVGFSVVVLAVLLWSA